MYMQLFIKTVTEVQVLPLLELRSTTKQMSVKHPVESFQRVSISNAYLFTRRLFHNVGALPLLQYDLSLDEGTVSKFPPSQRKLRAGT